MNSYNNNNVSMRNHSQKISNQGMNNGGILLNVANNNVD